jgi:hypothetical protein
VNTLPTVAGGSAEANGRPVGRLRMTLRAPSFLFALVVYAAFFASSAASLIAEVTWNRMLIIVVGNSLGTTALIIVAYVLLSPVLYARWRVCSFRSPAASTSRSVSPCCASSSTWRLC